MDPSRFDELTRLLSGTGGRRSLVRALLGAALGTATSAATMAKHRRHDRGEAPTKHRGQRQHHQQGKDQGQDRGHGQQSGRPHAKDTRAARTPATATACCGTGNCTPGPGKNLTQCCYQGQNLAGANFKSVNATRASFRSATLTNADFRGANLSGSCLVGADIRGARFGGANQQGVIRCRTQTGAGIDNSGCSQGTACCRTELGSGEPCRSTPDCGEQTCQTKACQNETCVYTPVADGPSPNDLCTTNCCQGTCCPAGATECNPSGQCCAPNCVNPDRACGPDGCGGTCGTCPEGTACFDESGQCICNPGTCDGCCADTSTTCQPGTSPQACGSGGAPCASCGAQEVCRNGQCCAPACNGKQCGPDGCGGSCGSCQTGQRCNANGRCVCDAQSCPDGCCDDTGACRPGTANRACGRGGGSCTACAAGQGCIDQGCAVCGPETCPHGCCAADNTCQPGGAFQNCGRSGAQCASCTEAQTCQGGQCVGCGSNCTCTGQSICADPGAPNVICSGTSSPNLCICFVSTTGQPFCAGGSSNLACNTDADCQSNPLMGPGAVCVHGTSVPQCGGSATNFCVTPCAVCNPPCPSGQRCSTNTGTGQCICDPLSCPDGCCINGPGNPGRCLPSTSSQCRVGGAMCVDCPTGTSCNARGHCVCTPQSCSTGCCDGNNTCQPGRTIELCGTGGESCTSCSGNTPACGQTGCVACGAAGVGTACRPPDGGTDQATCHADGRCCVDDGNDPGPAGPFSCDAGNCCSGSCVGSSQSSRMCIGGD